MLHWPSGGHKNDGIWASHWYNSAWNSTGFLPQEGPLPSLTPKMQVLCDRALPFYEKMCAED